MIEIYTKPVCPYCDRAKAFLKKKELPFTEHDVSKQEDRDAIIAKTGHKTVPIIIINGHLIGGFDDLMAADQNGELEKLLNNG